MRILCAPTASPPSDPRRFGRLYKSAAAQDRRSRFRCEYCCSSSPRRWHVQIPLFPLSSKHRKFRQRQKATLKSLFNFAALRVFRVLKSERQHGNNQISRSAEPNIFSLNESRSPNAKRMRKDQQSTRSKRTFGLTIVNQSLVLFIIFCFAGCATGSCLSYGHSCWGAHGKRSYNGRNAQHRSIDSHSDGSLITEVETDGNAPSSQDRWILSRLITGRLTVPAPVLTARSHRSSDRWYGTQKLVALPGNWDTDYDSAKNEIFRDQKVKTNLERVKNSVESNEDSKEFDDSFDLTPKIAEPNAETSDILFVPTRREYDYRPSSARRLKLLKILADSSDDKLK